MSADAGKRVIPSPGWLRRLDGRIKLALLMAACFICQWLPLERTPEWLPAWAAEMAAVIRPALQPIWLGLLGLCFFARELRTAGVMAMLRGGAYFTAFWFVVKAGADWLWGADLSVSVWSALPLAGRLFSLTLVGMIFVGVSSPMETGRAAAWYMRPVIGRYAWKPALAIALTAWFLPQTLRLASDVSAAIRARGLELPWRKKALLILGTSLRILEHKAGELAVGLASRRLDDGRTWGRYA